MDRFSTATVNPSQILPARSDYHSDDILRNGGVAPERVEHLKQDGTLQKTWPHILATMKN